jgi:hypothetical protein
MSPPLANKAMSAKTKIALAAALVVMLLAAIVWPQIENFLKVDACLDRGGRWNHSASQCEI